MGYDFGFDDEVEGWADGYGFDGGDGGMGGGLLSQQSVNPPAFAPQQADLSGFSPNINPEMGGHINRRGWQEGIDQVYGGGLMGNIARGVGSLFGISQQLAARKGGLPGVEGQWNPGSLMGLSGIPGAGMLGQYAYGATGLPQVSMGVRDPLAPVPQDPMAEGEADPWFLRPRTDPVGAV